jgi:hypothetical protein
MTAQPLHIPNATPFDLIADDADDLLTEARAWADGEAIATQAQADEVSRLIEGLRLNAKAADDARKEENRPHDDAKAAVQAKYAPLWADPKTKTPGKVFKAIDALKAALAPYLRKLDDEKREAERKAREEAEAKAREAAEAMRAANAADLGAREEAEAKVAEAEAAARAVKAAEADKAHAVGGTRAMGLRTKWTATLTDQHAAAAHFWRTNPEAFLPLLQRLADDQVRAGKRGGIPGVTIVEERVL